MRHQHYRVFQVKFGIFDFPPKDYILMMKISSIVLYNKHVRDAHSSEALKKKFGIAINVIIF